MTDSSPSKKCFYCRDESWDDGPPCKYCGNSGKSAPKQCAECARYESGRVILTQMIDEYKALVESLKAERDSYKQQAEVNAQTVRDQAMVIRDMRGDDNATY